MCTTAFHQQNMAAEIRNVFRLALDDNDLFAMHFVQFPQYCVDAVGVRMVKLGNKLVKDEHIRAERHRSGQRQEMRLPA